MKCTRKNNLRVLKNLVKFDVSVVLDLLSLVPKSKFSGG